MLLKPRQSFRITLYLISVYYCHTEVLSHAYEALLWFPWKRKTSQRIMPLLELIMQDPIIWQGDQYSRANRLRCDVTFKPNYCNHTNPDVTQSQPELYCSYGNPITVAMKGVQSLTQSVTHRTSTLYTGRSNGAIATCSERRHLVLSKSQKSAASQVRRILQSVQRLGHGLVRLSAEARDPSLF